MKTKAIDYLSPYKNKLVKPSEKVINEFGKDAVAVFCEKNGCWSIEREVEGEIIDGWFTPYPGQSVTYKIRMHD
jgi:hypothetical protein